MNLSHWVIVFDLDDTLISELEYQRSGISEVEKVINSIYNVSFEGRIQRALNDGVQDIFGWACEELGLPADVKSSFLWIYRLHSPDIKLAKGVEDLVSRLLDCGANLAILSDGRSITSVLSFARLGCNICRFSFPRTTNLRSLRSIVLSPLKRSGLIVPLFM